ELLGVRRWATPVPLALFARVTGEREFPPEIRDAIADSELSYYGNAELTFRLGEVTVGLDTRWHLTAPPGGGDSHRTVIRGTHAEIKVEQGALTGFRRRLTVLPRVDAERVRAALERTVAACQSDYPGVAVSTVGSGWEIRVPGQLDTGHESH